MARVTKGYAGSLDYSSYVPLGVNGVGRKTRCHTGCSQNYGPLLAIG